MAALLRRAHKLCGWPAGSLKDVAAGSWNWITSSVSTGPIYVSRLKRISGQENSFSLQNMLATVETGLRRVAEQQYWPAGVYTTYLYPSLS